jgi:uncharacterized protein (DUF58 family)
VSLGADRPVVPDENLVSRRPWYAIAVGLLVLSLVLRQPLLVLAGLLVGALGAIPELWYRYCLAGVVARRRLGERRAMFGDTVALTLSVENRKPLPLPWLELRDELPAGLPVAGTTLHPSYKQDRVVMESTLALWLYQRVTRRYAVRCVARGSYAFGPLLLRSGDPFGLLTREQRLEDVERLIVYPLVVPIARLGLPAQHPFGERTTRRRLIEDPLRVAGVRPYVAGDEPRRIHWKASARVGSPQSKVYEPATRHTLVLFVDMRTLDNPVLGYDPALFELALCTAASVVAWALEQGYAVGLYSNGTLAPSDDVAPAGAAGQGRDDETPARRAARALASGAAALRPRVPPAAHTAQLPRALEVLARIYPYLGMPIERVVEAEQGNLPYGATVVYVGAAAMLGAGAVAAFERLRARGHAVTLLLVGEAAPAAGTLPVHRVGGKETWDALSTEALAGGGPGHGLTVR